MSGAPIEGRVEPRFEPVRDAFAANFDRAPPFQELGAALAVYEHGRCVVDLWGGWRDPARTQPWERDTLVNVWSTTKGLLAAAVAQLVDRGLLAYDAPVATWWPEFAAGGKGQVTVAELLSHQAGLNGFDAPMPYAACLDWAEATGRLAAQAPAWPPGTDTSYHALTFGWLAGELIRRASGAAGVGAYLREHLTGPLAADFHVGLPAALHGRVAEIVAPPPPSAGSAPDPIAMRAFMNPTIPAETANTVAWREAEVPAGNGQASAQGVARVYAALAAGGALDGVRIVSPRAVERMVEARSTRPDRALGPRRWAAGVALNATGLYGPCPDTFGHSGWGGSFGCADLGTGIAIGYVMNGMAAQLNDDPRARSLATAVFDAAARG